MKTMKMILATLMLLTQRCISETFYRFKQLSVEGQNCLSIRKMMDELPFLNNYTFDTLKYPIRSFTNRKVSFREVLMKKLFFNEIKLDGINLLEHTHLETSFDKLVKYIKNFGDLDELTKVVQEEEWKLNDPMYDMKEMRDNFTDILNKVTMITQESETTSQKPSKNTSYFFTPVESSDDPMSSSTTDDSTEQQPTENLERVDVLLTDVNRNYDLKKSIDSIKKLILLRNLSKFVYMKQYLEPSDFKSKFFNDFIMKRGSLFTKSKILKLKVAWLQRNISGEMKKVKRVSDDVMEFSDLFLKEITQSVLTNDRITDIIKEVLKDENSEDRRKIRKQKRKERKKRMKVFHEMRTQTEHSNNIQMNQGGDLAQNVEDDGVDVEYDTSSPLLESTTSENPKTQNQLEVEEDMNNLRTFIKLYQLFNDNQKYLNNFEMNSLYNRPFLDFLLLVFPDTSQSIIELYIGAINAYKSEFILTNLRDKIEEFILIFKKKNESIKEMKIELPQIKELTDEPVFDLDESEQGTQVLDDSDAPLLHPVDSSTEITFDESLNPSPSATKKKRRKTPKIFRVISKRSKEFYARTILKKIQPDVSELSDYLQTEDEQEQPPLELSVVAHLNKINKLIKSYNKEKVGKIATLKKNYKNRMKLIKKSIMDFDDYVVYINQLFEFFFRMKKLAGYNKELFEYHNQYLKISSVQENIQADNVGDFTLSPDSIDEIDAQIQSLETDRLKGFNINNLKESPGLSVHNIQTIMLPYEMFYEKNKSKIEERIVQLKLKLDLVRGLISLERIIDQHMGAVFANIQQIEDKYQCFVKTDLSHYMFQIMKLNVVIDEGVFMESFYSQIKSDRYIRDMVYLNYSTITSDDYLQDLIRKNSAQKVFLEEEQQKLITTNLYRKHIEHYSLVLNMFKDYMEFRIGTDKTNVNSFGFMKKFKLYFQRFVRTIKEKIRNYDLTQDNNYDIVYNFIIERSVYFLTGFIPIVGSIPIARSIISYLVYSIVGTFLKFVIKMFGLGLSFISEVLQNCKFSWFPKDKTRNIAFNYEYYFRKVPVGTPRNKFQTIVDFSDPKFIKNMKENPELFMEQRSRFVMAQIEEELKLKDESSSVTHKEQQTDTQEESKRSWKKVLSSLFRKKNTDEEKLNLYLNPDSALTDEDIFGTQHSTDFGTEYIFEVYKASFRDIMDMTNEEIINLTKNETQELSKEEVQKLTEAFGVTNLGNLESLNSGGEFFHFMDSPQSKNMEKEINESIESSEHEQKVINFDIVEEKFYTNAADKTSIMNIVDSSSLFTEESYLMSEKELKKMKYLLSDEQQKIVSNYFDNLIKDIEIYKKSTQEHSIPNNTPTLSRTSSEKGNLHDVEDDDIPTFMELDVGDMDDGLTHQKTTESPQLSMSPQSSMVDMTPRSSLRPPTTDDDSPQGVVEIQNPYEAFKSSQPSTSYDNSFKDFMKMYNKQISIPELVQKLERLKTMQSINSLDESTLLRSMTKESSESNETSPLIQFLNKLTETYKDFTIGDTSSESVASDSDYLTLENEKKYNIIEDYKTSRKFILFQGAFQENLKKSVKQTQSELPPPPKVTTTQIENSGDDDDERKLLVLNKSQNTQQEQRKLVLTDRSVIYEVFDDDHSLVKKEEMQEIQDMMLLQLERQNYFVQAQEVFMERLDLLKNVVKNDPSKIPLLESYILESLLRGSGTGIDLNLFNMANAKGKDFHGILMHQSLVNNSSMDFFARKNPNDSLYEYDSLVSDPQFREACIPKSALFAKRNGPGTVPDSITVDDIDLQNYVRDLLLSQKKKQYLLFAGDNTQTCDPFSNCTLLTPISMEQGIDYFEDCRSIQKKFMRLEIEKNQTQSEQSLVKFEDGQSRITVSDLGLEQSDDKGDKGDQIIEVPTKLTSVNESDSDDVQSELSDINIAKYLNQLLEQRKKTKFTEGWDDLLTEDDYSSELQKLLVKILYPDDDSSTQSDDSPSSQQVSSPTVETQSSTTTDTQDDLVQSSLLNSNTSSEDEKFSDVDERNGMFEFEDMNVKGNQDLLEDFGGHLPSVMYKFNIHRFKNIIAYLKQKDSFHFSGMNMVLYFREFEDLPVDYLEEAVAPEKRFDDLGVDVKNKVSSILIKDGVENPQTLEVNPEFIQEVPTPVNIYDSDLGISTETDDEDHDDDDGDDDGDTKQVTFDVSTSNQHRELLSDNLANAKNIKQVKKVEKFII